jgi:8-oxo-dGTP diphosphatase
MPKPFKLSVQAIILDGNSSCLLLRRSPDCGSFARQWEWPGGKLDDGEDFVTALVREVREETALAVEITRFAGATSFEMPTVQVIALCMETKVTSGTLQLSEEHDDFAWVPLADVAQLELAEHVRPFMLDYAANHAQSR